MGAKSGLEVFNGRKISCRCQELNQNSFAHVEFSTGFSLVTKNEFVLYMIPLCQWQDAVEVALFANGSINHTAGFYILAVVLIR